MTSLQGRVGKPFFLCQGRGALQNGIFYITGPPAMVKGMQAMLAGIGVHETDVRVEEYTGY